MESHGEAPLFILDPLNLANNTTRNSYLVNQILKHFEVAASRLRQHVGCRDMEASETSAEGLPT